MQTLQPPQSQPAGSSSTNTKPARMKPVRKETITPILPVESGESEPSTEVKTKSAVFSLPPEQAPQLQALRIAVIAIHDATRKVGTDLVTCVTKCGLVLLLTKDMVGRGNFETWFSNQDFGFTKVTRCKYMRLSTRLCEEVECKPGSLLTISPAEDGKPMSVMYNEDRLRAIIKEVCVDRTLSELYSDWEIKKTGVTTVEETKSDVDEQPKTKDSAEKVFGIVLRFMEKMPTVFKRLKPENRAELVSKLEALLVNLKSSPQPKSI